MDLSNVTIDMLKGNQRELAEVVGMEAYIKLVKVYGGDRPYVAKEDKLLAEIRDNEIYRTFNGGNHAQLAKKYNLTTRAVYEIIERKKAESAYTQLSILDEE